MSGQWNDKRPMSPHLQIWRWHPAMLSSILHRATSIISYAGLIKVAIALLIVAITGKLPLEDIIFSPLGAIGLFIFVFSFIFMALAQLRHAILKWMKSSWITSAGGRVHLAYWRTV